jgi:hypothetical protein
VIAAGIILFIISREFSKCEASVNAGWFRLRFSNDCVDVNKFKIYTPYHSGNVTAVTSTVRYIVPRRWMMDDSIFPYNIHNTNMSSCGGRCCLLDGLDDLDDLDSQTVVTTSTSQTIKLSNVTPEVRRRMAEQGDRRFKTLRDFVRDAISPWYQDAILSGLPVPELFITDALGSVQDLEVSWLTDRDALVAAIVQSVHSLQVLVPADRNMEHGY